jgi:hypothetical protein
MRRIDFQPAAHEGLGRAQLGIAGDVAGGLAVREAQMDGSVRHAGRAGAVCVQFPVMVGDDHLPVADQPVQQFVQQPHRQSLSVCLPERIDDGGTCRESIHL